MGREAKSPSVGDGTASFEGYEQIRTRVRLARREDNDWLVELMGHVPMDEGSLVLSTRRDPDFFGLYDLQRGVAEAFVYDDPAFSGIGTSIVRDGWLDGRKQKVGYLGDLRLRGTGRARRHFPSLFGHFFEQHVERTGCEDFYTAVLAHNQLAIQSLVRRTKKSRGTQPHYHLLRRYDMASVQLLLPRRPRVPSGLTVSSALPTDVPALAAFLHGDHLRRPFGYCFDDGELEHRLARWPGFTLERTLVARAGDGRIVGCTTPWDVSPVKRYRVVRYGGAMRLLRLGMAAASAVLGCPALPAEGEDFHSHYLANLSVENDDPVILRALLEVAYARAWEDRVHLLSLPLYEGPNGEPDPLAPALRGFAVQRLPFHLYGVSRSARARTDWPPGRPGFEMALA
ncbi:MAG: hypothetical protein RL653_343 [Pseudomonadota bacterium]